MFLFHLPLKYNAELKKINCGIKKNKNKNHRKIA